MISLAGWLECDVRLVELSNCLPARTDVLCLPHSCSHLTSPHLIHRSTLAGNLESCHHPSSELQYGSVGGPSSGVVWCGVAVVPVISHAQHSPLPPAQTFTRIFTPTSPAPHVRIWRENMASGAECWDIDS